MKNATGERLWLDSRKLQKVSKYTAPYRYLSPTLLLLAVLLAVPIFIVIYYSFFDNVFVNPNPIFVGLENYRAVLSDKRFQLAVTNTLFFVGVSVIGHFVIGMFFAMLLNSPVLGSRTKGIFRLLYALPWMFTATVIAILWQMMLNPNGVINYLLSITSLSSTNIAWLSSRKYALSAVTFMNIWAGYPFFMVSILAGLQGISGDLYEASSIDGAGAVRQFFHITVPQLKPILISLLTLDFVWTIFQFDLIWITTGGGPIGATETLSTYIYKQAFTRYEYAQASASAVIILLACSIIAIFYARQQRERG